MTDSSRPAASRCSLSAPLFPFAVRRPYVGFFRLQIPWRGVLFSEKALLRVRRECFRPTDPADSYRKVAGGLNLDSVFGVLGARSRHGMEFDYLAVNNLPQASAAASIRFRHGHPRSGAAGLLRAQRVRRFAPCRPRLKQGVPNGLHLVLAPQRTREQASFHAGFRCELKSDHEN